MLKVTKLLIKFLKWAFGTAFVVNLILNRSYAPYANMFISVFDVMLVAIGVFIFENLIINDWKLMDSICIILGIGCFVILIGIILAMIIRECTHPASAACFVAFIIFGAIGIFIGD